MSIFLLRFFSSLALFGFFSFAFFSKHEFFFITLITIVSLISLFELSKLIELRNIYSILYWVIPIACSIIYLNNNHNILLVTLISTFFWLFIATFSVFKGKIFINSIKFLYGFIIIFGLYISTFYLFKNDKNLLLISLFIVWFSDIFAYIFGSYFGKRKLAPLISPGKTYEGIYGAFAVNFILIIFISFFFSYSFKSLFILILLIIPLSILGDLFESLLKRGASKKDSGNLIPGHGGFLDRIDGLLSSLPVVALLSFFGFTF